MKGVVAAGHPLTAEAGAEALRAGGNAVDAAVACVLMSFVAESPLTGPGAGGFMLVHTAEGEDHLLDFFVAAPGRGLGERTPAELTPIDVTFAEDAVQRFNVGPSSVRRLRHDDRAGPGARALRHHAARRAHRGAGRGGARRASRCVPMQALPVQRAGADLPLDARSARPSTRPEGGCSRPGTRSGCPSWATCSSGSAPRARASSTRATWPPP